MEDNTTETNSNPGVRYRLGVAVFLLILLGGLGYFVYTDFYKTPGVAPEETTELPAPDLSRSYEPPARLPESVKEESRQKVADIKTALTENSAAMSKWLELAAYYKASEDYEGAEEILQYVVFRWPADEYAYANLGELYVQTKNYEQAEAHYRQAIGLKPAFIPVYRSLHDLYRLWYKTDTTAAVDILHEGLEANPGNTDLLLSLAYYYQEKGDGTNARKYFQEALAAAKKGGNADLSAGIEAELESL
jgi:tetratricopeptide (TPR) repeat protein